MPASLFEGAVVASAVRNAIRIARAVGTNRVARLFPSMYVHLTGQTGRGDRTGETPEAVADYFLRCFKEYFEVLAVSPEGIGPYLADKVLVEYGPGDLPGVALLMLAHGARQVICVDRFPLVRFSSFATATLKHLLGALPAAAAERARRALRDPADISQGLREEWLQYLVTRDGLCGRLATADMVFSRAVLEHVNDLGATFRDMAAALKPDGIAIHLVDLKSHGLHRDSPLDFLTWPSALWDLMYSAKGVPNRWRVDRYRREIESASLQALLLRSSSRYTAEDIARVRPRLAAPFRGIDDEDLAWAGFWLVCKRRT